MSTIQSSIQLFNGITPVLQNITNALDMTINRFERIQTLFNNSMDTASLHITRNEIRSTEANIIRTEQTLRRMTITAQNVNSNFHNMSSSVNRSSQDINHMSKTMQQLDSIVNQSSQTMQQLNNSTNQVIQTMQHLNDIIKENPPHINKAASTQNILNRNISNGTNAANNFLGVLKNIASVYLSLKGIDIVGKLSDTVTSITARLNIINDGLQTTVELSDKIAKSAFDAGAGYIDTAAAISKMGVIVNQLE